MKKILYILSAFIIAIFTFCVINSSKEETIQTSSVELSNKKIEWGIKRNDNHEQPDLGATNKRIIEEAKGIAMGNSHSIKL